jgi:hypothetical protein
MTPNTPEEDLAERWYEHKSQLLESSLGESHDTVMHAIIPYAIGGALDLYYYPNGLPGTAIATMELSELPNEGSSNDMYRSYEIVMFTRHQIDLASAYDDSTAFGRAHKNINAILNIIAPYSAEATLNPNDTCEFPVEIEHVGGKCLIFDAYACHSDDMVENFGLLAIIEIFRSEMEYARTHGASELFNRLKAKGYYPYSDLDRDPVV